MKRQWHYLKSNERNETLQQCIFVDTETRYVSLDEKYHGHILRFGWAAATRRNGKGQWTKPEWKRFTNYEEFWLWAMSFTRPKVKTWVWCHNASFDYPVLNAFCHLVDLGWRLEGAIIDAPPTVVKYRCDGKTLVLCDTLNIWRMSLKELGSKIGLEKLTMPEKWGAQEDDDYYCRRDVEIILKSVTGWADFLRSNNMGGFCPTIAGQSMRSFRHRWLRDKILIDAHDSALEVSRKAYHGGRCECGHIGSYSGEFYLLDVNSMYPYVMSFAEMPIKLRGYSTTVHQCNLPAMLEKYCLCAKVRLNTQKAAFGIVHEGKLCFPVGRFDAYICTPEIEYALQQGCIEEVYFCASYDKAATFRNFAIDLYRYKEEATRAGNLVEARHFKLLLNSFYGKWGQNGRKWTEIGTCDPHLFMRHIDINAQSLKKTVLRYFGGKILARSDEAESSHSHPAIAAHVCAHARMILWALIEKIPPTEYFYCDTDSLLVSAAGLDVLTDCLDDHRLGGLKKVKRLKDITIYGCKDYVLDGEKTLKGIRPKAHRVDEVTYTQIKWTGLPGLLASSSLNMPLTCHIDKTLRRTYDKGTIGAGGRVFPLHLDGGGA